MVVRYMIQIEMVMEFLLSKVIITLVKFLIFFKYKTLIFNKIIFVIIDKFKFIMEKLSIMFELINNKTTNMSNQFVVLF